MISVEILLAALVLIVGAIIFHCFRSFKVKPFAILAKSDRRLINKTVFIEKLRVMNLIRHTNRNLCKNHGNITKIRAMKKKYWKGKKIEREFYDIERPDHQPLA